MKAAAFCIIKVVILAVYARYLTIAVPFLAVIVYFTQKFYLRTSRQMRLLDIEAKAPLYSHFLDTVGGATGIRAFRWHAAFEATCIDLLDISQRPVYLLFCIQQCLAFVLDIIVSILAVLLVATVVAWRDSFQPGQVGVALVLVMTFNIDLTQLVKFWTMLETSIGAVARVKDFTTSTPSEQKTTEVVTPPPTWPSAGGIKFSGIVASYS